MGRFPVRHPAVSASWIIDTESGVTNAKRHAANVASSQPGGVARTSTFSRFVASGIDARKSGGVRREVESVHASVGEFGEDVRDPRAKGLGVEDEMTGRATYENDAFARVVRSRAGTGARAPRVVTTFGASAIPSWREGDHRGRTNEKARSAT
jgi:hypothetical protein